jgi:hypothetical protein
VLEHASLTDARGVVGALELDRHLRLDLLVEADLEAVQMGDLTPHRMMLLLLDHDGDRGGAVDLEVEQCLALREDRAKLASRDLEGARFAALAVDDTRHQAVPAQAASCPRAEYLARRDLECGSVLCHVPLPNGWRLHAPSHDPPGNPR